MAQNLKTLKDVWQLYSIRDSTSLHEGLENMQVGYSNMGIPCCLSQFVSISQAALFLILKKATNSKPFTLLPTEELFQEFRNSLVGGPSVVAKRVVVSGSSKIREHVYHSQALAVKTIQSWDFNSLYPYGGKI